MQSPSKTSGQGIPCLLKKKKGVLVLEIENYGVINVADERSLQTVSRIHSKKKSKSRKHKHEIKEKKTIKEPIHKEEELTSQQFDDKSNEIKKETTKQSVKEQSVEPQNTQKDQSNSSTQELNRQTIKVSEPTTNKETKEVPQKTEEKPQEVEKEHQKKQKVPIKRDPSKPIHANPDPKKKKNKQNPKQLNHNQSSQSQNNADDMFLDSAESDERVNYVAERGILQHSSNDAELDKDIARGYLLVNTGKMKEAIAHFDSILRKNTKLVGAYLGRGSARAMIGEFQKAVSDFTAAIKIDSTCGDSYKRRGQTRLALGQVKLALDDFNKAVEITNSTDADCFRQRGIAYHAIGAYDRAAQDFKMSMKLQPGNPDVINDYAMCLNAMGLCDEAIDAYSKAINTKESFITPYVHLGQLYRDMGCYVRAKAVLDKALRLDPNTGTAALVLANVYISAGRHREALPFISRALAYSPDEKKGEIHRMHSSCSLALGAHRESLQHANSGIKLKDDVSWYYGEIAKYQSSMLDKSFTEYDLEWFPSLFKVNFAKRLPPGSSKKYTAMRIGPKDVAANDTVPKTIIDDLIKPARLIGSAMQYDEIGFGKNCRHFTACGLASIYVAQLLRQNKMAWREIAEIFTKFRQIAEPADGVLWIDKLPRQQFEEGFGSNTTLKTQQTRVARYWPMFERTFNLFKTLYANQKGVSSDKASRVTKAKTVEEVQAIVRNDNYYVTTICRNMDNDILEGTWLLIEKKDGGCMFSIKTPCTPKRYKIYDGELKKALDHYYGVLDSSPNDSDAILDASLRMAYLWFNFMPLSRGTAGCGMYWLFSLLLTAGYVIDSTIPKGFQCDWEALLNENQSTFITNMRSWIVLKPLNVNDLPDVSTSLPTLRDVIQALNISPLLMPLQ
ncbi:TPR repeat protein [Entamoeba marina]